MVPYRTVCLKAHLSQASEHQISLPSLTLNVRKEKLIPLFRVARMCISTQVGLLDCYQVTRDIV